MPWLIALWVTCTEAILIDLREYLHKISAVQKIVLTKVVQTMSAIFLHYWLWGHLKVKVIFCRKSCFWRRTLKKWEILHPKLWFLILFEWVSEAHNQMKKRVEVVIVISGVTKEHQLQVNDLQWSDLEVDFTDHLKIKDIFWHWVLKVWIIFSPKLCFLKF